MLSAVWASADKTIAAIVAVPARTAMEIFMDLIVLTPSLVKYGWSHESRLREDREYCVTMIPQSLPGNNR
jgi:hypothetical protein